MLLRINKEKFSKYAANQNLRSDLYKKMEEIPTVQSNEQISFLVVLIFMIIVFILPMFVHEILRWIAYSVLFGFIVIFCVVAHLKEFESSFMEKAEITSFRWNVDSYTLIQRCTLWTIQISAISIAIWRQDFLTIVLLVLFYLIAQLIIRKAENIYHRALFKALSRR